MSPIPSYERSDESSNAHAIGNGPNGRTSLQGTRRIRDHEESRKGALDLQPAAVSEGPLEEADLFILRSGEPEVGGADGDLN